MRLLILYGTIILFGLMAAIGVGLVTFLLGERLSSHRAAPISISGSEPVGTEAKEFQLVVKETEVNFECPAGPIFEQQRVSPHLEVVLVNEPPDLRVTELVSMSGCPLSDSYPHHSTTCLKQTY